ncbi:GNAT family N-acyltransferase [Mesobacterium sp. TK19101]|uniref:L-ornithine N(alpha)-acyltransferase n=1 Tax=Mesobacterium hydrothermale TaxID=3111907 RepID=A0ABU6HG91_9RHOB|nr:GNAT family N-acyltransferase [Mesobacterium sp. TK19101]MEC3860483.1 GNAT family N-acyltransferase [Mesobacterium sp. TK19101]
MTASQPLFTVRLARDAEDLIAAQRLRYDVFVGEMGSQGALVDHDARLEQDRFDPYFDHMLLIDEARPGAPVVGVYRLLRDEQARAMGQFYSEDEYDLAPLRTSGLPLLELGRSCLHPDYRGGLAMYHLWNALARYVEDHGIRILFGVASFPGTDIQALAHPLSQLHDRHLAPPELRVTSRGMQRMDLIPPDAIDRKRAMVDTPALIKAYLKLGGFVGDGAFVDHGFNTTDVCLILDTARMNDRQRAIYTGGRG